MRERFGVVGVCASFGVGFGMARRSHQTRAMFVSLLTAMAWLLSAALSPALQPPERTDARRLSGWAISTLSAPMDATQSSPRIQARESRDTTHRGFEPHVPGVETREATASASVALVISTPAPLPSWYRVAPYDAMAPPRAVVA